MEGIEPLWVSIVVTTILVCITGYYAYQTRRIAKTSEDTARAAVEQAHESRQQRISASQPVVWPAIEGWKIYRLMTVFENIGNGPALEVDILIHRGEDFAPEHSEHVHHSYLIAGDKRKHDFLSAGFDFKDAYGIPGFSDATLSGKVGDYTLLVEWRDLYKSGPFFRARLPFRLELDSERRLSVNEGTVTIERVTRRIKEPSIADSAAKPSGHRSAFEDDMPR